jgi:hypothetical protein
MRRTGWALVAAVLAAWAAVALADDPAIVEMAGICKTDATRPLPKHEVVRLPEGERQQGDGLRNASFGIQVRFQKGGARLGEWSVDTEKNGTKWEHGVREDTVVAGWLAGAPDILVLAWGTEPHPMGSGRNYYHGSLLLRIKDGEPVELLRRSACVTMRRAHMAYGNGTEGYAYEYDRKGGFLVERLDRYAELLNQRDRPPLHHATKDEGGETVFAAAIRERIERRYRYSRGRLEELSTALFYQAQPVEILGGVEKPRAEEPRYQAADTLRDIACFYLGPWAPASAVLKANPGLEKTLLRPAPSGDGTVPAGTWVRVPVPEEWLRARVR